MYLLGSLKQLDQIPPFLQGVYLIHNRYHRKVYLNYSDSIHYRMQSYRSCADREMVYTLIENDIHSLGEHWFDVYLVEAFDTETLSPIQKEERVEYWVNVFQAFKPERGYNVRGSVKSWETTKKIAGL